MAESDATGTIRVSAQLRNDATDAQPTRSAFGGLRGERDYSNTLGGGMRASTWIAQQKSLSAASTAAAKAASAAATSLGGASRPRAESRAQRGIGQMVAGMGRRLGGKLGGNIGEIVKETVASPFRLVGAAARQAGTGLARLGGPFSGVATAAVSTGGGFAALGIGLVVVLPAVAKLAGTVQLLRSSYRWAQEAADRRMQIVSQTRRRIPSAISGPEFARAMHRTKIRNDTVAGLVGEGYAQQLEENISRSFSDAQIARGVAGDRDIYARHGINEATIRAFEGAQGLEEGFRGPIRMDALSWLKLWVQKREEFDAKIAAGNQYAVAEKQKLLDDAVLIVDQQFADAVGSTTTAQIEATQRAAEPASQPERLNVAEDTVEFQTAVSSIRGLFQNFKRGVVIDVTPSLVGIMTTVTKWLQHTDETGKRMDVKLGEIVGALAVNAWRTLGAVMARITRDDIDKVISALRSIEPSEELNYILKAAGLVRDLVGILSFKIAIPKAIGGPGEHGDTIKDIMLGLEKARLHDAEALNLRTKQEREAMAARIREGEEAQGARFAAAGQALKDREETAAKSIRSMGEEISDAREKARRQWDAEAQRQPATSFTLPDVPKDAPKPLELPKPPAPTQSFADIAARVARPQGAPAPGMGLDGALAPGTQEAAREAVRLNVPARAAQAQGAMPANLRLRSRAATRGARAQAAQIGAMASLARIEQQQRSAQAVATARGGGPFSFSGGGINWQGLVGAPVNVVSSKPVAGSGVGGGGRFGGGGASGSWGDPAALGAKGSFDPGTLTGGKLHQAAEAALKGGPAAVQNFVRSAGLGYASNAWCGQFAAAVVKQAGLKPPPGAAIASNWRSWGLGVATPQPGDIAVRRPPGQGGHASSLGSGRTGEAGSHVTFIRAISADGKMVQTVGGNQSGIRWEPITRYDYRRAPSQPGQMQAALQQARPQVATANMAGIGARPTSFAGPTHSGLAAQRRSIMSGVDPSTQRLLHQMMATEGGGAATVEALFNRVALVRQRFPNYSIKEELNSGFYGPIKKGIAQRRAVSEKQAAEYNEAIGKVLAGSNIIRGRTNQGSGSDPDVNAPGKVPVAGSRESYNYWRGRRRGTDFGFKHSEEFAKKVERSGGAERSSTVSASEAKAPAEREREKETAAKLGMSMEELKKAAAARKATTPGSMSPFRRELDETITERATLIHDVSAQTQTATGQRFNPQGLVVHHTGGRGGVGGVVNTLRQRGLGIHYVIDRDGNIVQTGDPTRTASHAGTTEKAPGLGNFSMLGVEVIAANEKDVTPAQRAAIARLAGETGARFGFDPKRMTFGHGELTARKQADEGATARMIREGILGVPGGRDKNEVARELERERELLTTFSPRNVIREGTAAGEAAARAFRAGISDVRIPLKSLTEEERQRDRRQLEAA